MKKYNPEKLKEYRYGILSMYIADLKNLQKGNIPNCFDKDRKRLEETLPFFPDEERAKYQEVLEAGFFQAKFLQASQMVDALGDKTHSRKKLLMIF